MKRKKTNMTKIKILILLVVLNITYLQAQEIYPLKTKFGFIMIYNQPKTYFTVRVEGDEVKPSKQAGVFFVNNNKAIQLTIFRISEITEIKSAKTEKDTLIKHMNFELNHLSSKIKQELKISKQEFISLQNQNFLYWEYKLPENINTDLKIQQSLTTICNDYIFLLHGAAPNERIAEYVKQYLMIVANSVKVYKNKIDKNKLIEKIKTEIIFRPYDIKENTYFKNGNVKSKWTIENNRKIKNVMYFENGKVKAGAVFSKAGVLEDAYNLNENGDTIVKSNIPKFNTQPAKDLSFINWKYTKGEIGFYFANKSDGSKPHKGDKIKIKYIGYFENGKQFDNSEITGQLREFTFGQGEELPSFEEGVALFSVGQKGFIKIPPERAFGAYPAGNLPANSTLIYEIEILEIK